MVFEASFDELEPTDVTLRAGTLEDDLLERSRAWLTEEERRIKQLETQVDRLESHVEDLKSKLSERDETIEESKQDDEDRYDEVMTAFGKLPLSHRDA